MLFLKLIRALRKERIISVIHFFLQKETCTWAYEFLVERLKLDVNRLYVTYFGGNEKAGLEPDNEAKEIWTKLG